MIRTMLKFLFYGWVVIFLGVGLGDALTFFGRWVESLPMYEAHWISGACIGVCISALLLLCGFAAWSGKGLGK